MLHGIEARDQHIPWISGRVWKQVGTGAELQKTLSDEASKSLAVLGISVAFGYKQLREDFDMQNGKGL